MFIILRLCLLFFFAVLEIKPELHAVGGVYKAAVCMLNKRNFLDDEKSQTCVFLSFGRSCKGVDPDFILHVIGDLDNRNILTLVINFANQGFAVIEGNGDGSVLLGILNSVGNIVSQNKFNVFLDCADSEIGGYVGFEF